MLSVNGLLSDEMGEGIYAPLVGVAEEDPGRVIVIVVKDARVMVKSEKLATDGTVFDELV